MLRPRGDFYEVAAAAPDDVLLLIEAADSSLAYGRSVKLPLYARAGVREAWLVDLVRNEVITHRQPHAAAIETHRRGDRVALAAFPDLALAIDGLLG